jgi:hypothetical protein
MKDGSRKRVRDLTGTLAALKRAAKRARKIAIETNTPLWVMKNGRIVNLNPRAGISGDKYAGGGRK